MSARIYFIKTCLALLFIFFFALRAKTQVSKADSLTRALEITITDSAKVNLLNQLAEEHIISGNFQIAKNCAEQSLQICNQNLKGDIKTRNSTFLHEKADACNYIAIVYRYFGEYPEALEFHLRALKIREEIGDKKGMARSYLGIGSIYHFQGNLETSMQNYELALKMYREQGSTMGIGNTHLHMGDVLALQNKKKEAMSQYDTAIIFWCKIENYKGIAEVYNSIGLVYTNDRNYSEARDYYQKALTINKDGLYKDELIKSYTRMGLLEMQQNNFDQANVNLQKALTVALAVNSREDVKEIYKALYETDLKREDYRSAFNNYHTFNLYRDSLLNQQSADRIAHLQQDYEQQRKDLVLAEEKRTRELITYSLIAGLISLLVVVLLVYRNYRQKKKDAIVISEKNKIIETRNKDITDSITYANRIQRAKLPELSTIQEYLQNSFVLFKPKDIVSGDFYYFQKLGSKMIVAAADCTGHGVPGAFMSLIGIEKLDDAIAETDDTSKILSLLNKGMKKSLRQTDHEDSTRDGMDLALCTIDLDQRILNYSGANRPLWLIRKSATEVTEIKATKKAIGGLTADEQQFESHTLQMNAGDTIYLFTDGYTDTFGGPDGKRFTTKKFRELLFSFQHKDMNEQKEILNKTIENWLTEGEQVDDILVFGIRF